MQTYEAKGRVVAVGEIVNKNGFVKRELIVDTSTGNYPSPVKFLLKKDRTAKADGLKECDEVTVKFTIDGRKWDGPNGTAYFTDLTVWDITAEAKIPSPNAAAKDNPPVVDAAQGDPDELPF